MILDGVVLCHLQDEGAARFVDNVDEIFIGAADFRGGSKDYTGFAKNLIIKEMRSEENILKSANKLTFNTFSGTDIK